VYCLFCLKGGWINLSPISRTLKEFMIKLCSISRTSSKFKVENALIWALENL
jgi:hypothetical protein